MKEFGDEVITIEVLLLSFTAINDQGKEILSNYHINFDKLINEIKEANAEDGGSGAFYVFLKKRL